MPEATSGLAVPRSRVPQSQPAGPVQFSTEFNSGPLAGVLPLPQRSR